ncbi:MAG TPA: hypothetical protein VFZ48_02310, partial [Candidatus Saccharimonadales bacterium]
MMNINYQPLQTDISFSEAAKFKTSFGKLPGAAWAGIVLVVLMTGYFVFSGNIFGVLIPVVIAGIAYFALLANKKKEIRFKAFAEANGFEYISSGEPGVETGSVFEGGHARHAKRIVHGTYNLPFWLGTYVYSLGVASNSRTVKVGVMSIQLPASFPHILIDGGLHALGSAKAKGGFVEYQNVDPTVSEVYKVLYPEGQEHALQTIVTPDLLYTMRNRVPRKVDVEIRGDRMYLYTGMLLEPTEKNLKTLFTIL